MKPEAEVINLTLNKLLGKKYPEVHFDFSYYNENIYGENRIVSNIYMSAPESYYEKYGDGIKHYAQIETEVKTILSMFGFNSDDRIYYHWVGENHFD